MSDTFVRIPGGAQQESAPRGTPMSNEVSLWIGGKVWQGWTAIRIGRGIERFPSDFELALTERYPKEATVLFAEPGQTCVLKIGDDPIITGAIDRYVPAITASGHEVRIHGRSKCADLVDCSAGILPGNKWNTQFLQSSILSIAQQLAAPFDITVTSDAADASDVVLQLNVNLGETVEEIIDRISRWGGLLHYDDVDGNMILAQVGAEKMRSGFVQGVNVEAAGTTFSIDQRFSDYTVVWMSTDGLVQLRKELPDGSTNGNSRALVHDGSKPALRYRPHVIVSEQVDQDSDFGMRRAVWEMNRRNGRSRAVTLTTDTWRDSAGNLWAPNALAPIHIPLLKVINQRWIIGEVTYRLDESGTHADLTMMPPEAYSVEPFNLQPINKQVRDALRGPAGRDLPDAGPGYDPTTQGRGDL